MHANMSLNDIEIEMRRLKKLFRHDCKRLVVLNHQIAMLQLQYKISQESGEQSPPMALRHQLAYLQGVCTAKYGRSCKTAQLMQKLQETLTERVLHDAYEFTFDSEDYKEDKLVLGENTRE